MKATIWHNPRCSKSRAALAILNDAPGVTVEVIEYLKTPPTRAQLVDTFAAAGIGPRDALRGAEPVARESGLGDAGDDAILDAMAAHPILIERPIVITVRGAAICRPPERVLSLLA